MKIGRQHSRKVALSALALVSALGMSVPLASPASAASCTLQLSHIDPQRDPAGWWVSFTNCSVPQGYFLTTFTLWGADLGPDEQRTNALGVNPFPGTRADRSVLNEDDNLFDNDDEIYARLIASNGTSFISFETPEVSHEF